MWYEESGQGMAEYALIIFLIAIACLGGLKVLGASLIDIYERISTELN